jgi:membrane associated rhomboid family serine protease
MGVVEEKNKKSIYLGSDGNALVNLVVCISVLFVILKFILVIYQLTDLQVEAYYRNVFNWFVMPADLGKLVTRPWTLLTHMFVHQGVFHMIANLLWLWVFGYILQDLTGNRKLVPIFLYGGFAGALTYILAYYIVPRLQGGLPTAQLLGSNAAVMAVAIATTTVAPDYRIFPMINGGIPLWILTALYIIVNFAGLGSGDPAVYLSHVAGGAIGFFFIYQMRRGRDWSVWINQFFDWFDNLFNPNIPPKKKKWKDEFFYKVSGSKPYTKTPNLTQQRIDAILDKINQEGYHMLTQEEKEILRRAADEDMLKG